ncbi:unnamed protein product [Protopolystoma xenopodis]|uniref:Uncharacterized protein n=1 Tax=Protopolystoma xenopodis TaxID=117903 RepID=A0A3S4ZY37_9PLAT|nr:unnamed protein product [Protopolystoma xenopodis]
MISLQLAALFGRRLVPWTVELERGLFQPSIEVAEEVARPIESDCRIGPLGPRGGARTEAQEEEGDRLESLGQHRLLGVEPSVQPPRRAFEGMQPEVPLLAATNSSSMLLWRRFQIMRMAASTTRPEMECTFYHLPHHVYELGTNGCPIETLFIIKYRQHARPLIDMTDQLGQ